MGKIEDLLKKKIKESFMVVDRDSLIAFADYMLESIWKLPKERQKLIESIEITAGKIPKTKRRTRKPKEVSKIEPEPKAKPEPKPEKKPRKPYKKRAKTQEASDDDIARAIVEELRDEPEETIEVAEPPKEPTANIEEKQEELKPIEPEAVQEVSAEEEVHTIKTEEQEEVDEMMK